MSKKQIAEAIVAYIEKPHRLKMYMDHKDSIVKWAKALAAHLDAELGPTVDELLEVIGKYDEEHRGTAHYVKLYADYSGALCAGGSNRRMFEFPFGKHLATVIIEAIKAAMKPEPTAAERGLEALKRIFAYNGRYPVTWIAEDYQTVREALEAKT